MNIFITKSGKNTGPFSEQQINEMIDAGLLTFSDLAWHEGLSNWQELSMIVHRTNPPPLPIQKNSLYGKWNPCSVKFSACCPNCRQTKKYHINYNNKDTANKRVPLLPANLVCPKCGYEFQIEHARYPVWPSLLQFSVILIFCITLCAILVDIYMKPREDYAALFGKTITNEKTFFSILWGVIVFLPLIPIVISSTLSSLKNPRFMLRLSKISTISGGAITWAWCVILPYLGCFFLFVGFVSNNAKEKQRKRESEESNERTKNFLRSPIEKEFILPSNR
jgi:hypothetical protein